MASTVTGRINLPQALNCLAADNIMVYSDQTYDTTNKKMVSEVLADLKSSIGSGGGGDVTSEQFSALESRVTALEALLKLA